MSAKQRLTASLLACTVASFSGCVQYPNEQQSVVDLRPQISFRFDAADARMKEARVVLDGLEVGPLVDFRDGQAALRLRSGNHLVRVVSGGVVLWEESFYVGDGVSRPITVK